MGYIRSVFSSPKRVAQFSFVFLAILAVPITLTLIKDRQDLRQQASGFTSCADVMAAGCTAPNICLTDGSGNYFCGPDTWGAGPSTDSLTTEQCLASGQVCTIYNANQGCNCPAGTVCNFIGAQNPDGSQSVQCLPYPSPQAPQQTYFQSSYTTSEVEPKNDVTNTSSNSVKVIIQQNNTATPNIQLKMDIVYRTTPGTVVYTESKTTDTSGLATFSRPRSISSSYCRDLRLNTIYCYYFDNYFSRYFKYRLSITTPNRVFASTNTQETTFTSVSSDGITFQIIDNSPTATPTMTPSPTPTPTATPTLTSTPTPSPTTTIATYKCDFDGRNGPDIIDYTVWLGEFRSGVKNKADCDESGIIDIFDYAMWLGEFRRKSQAQP